MRTRGFPKQWEKALHPAINRAAMNNEAALREPLNHIGVAEPVADVPSDGEGDDVIGKAVA